MKRGRMMIALALALLPATLAAQDQLPDVERQLVARGAPVEWAQSVAEIVAAARAEGLPTAPLVSKALEGWAKRGRGVTPERILAVLGQQVGRFGTARDVARGTGLANPPGSLVAAAAEGLGRGMTPEDVRTVIAAAPTPEAAATGLMVAGSLAAQGLDMAASVRAVRDDFRNGRSAAELLELPSGMAALIGQSMHPRDIARQIGRGGGFPGRGAGHRPKGVPPTKGPPPQAKGKGRGND
ncbi:MAG: hypothetical protein O7I93_09430 [Gemmatimonadetes bacterium]|nr:hypothetical protein [Gemmatimonadota bacterium]